MGIYNIYCDESCHLENDGKPIMLLGGIWCPIEEVKRLAAELRDIKNRYKATGELKWTKVSKARQDFYLEVTAVTPDTCTGKDRFGLIFRAPTYNKGYIFYLACDGTYKLSYWNGANMISLQDWTAASEIEAGANKANRLGVKTEDNDISLYVNGKFLVALEDNSHIDEGYFGFVITGATTPEFTVTFDELMYWE